MQHMNFDAYSPVSRIKGDLNEKIFSPHSAAMIAAAKYRHIRTVMGVPLKIPGTAVTLSI